MPISMTAPILLKASIEKNRSTQGPLPSKKVLNQFNSCLICLVHTLPGYLAGDVPDHAAHNGSRNGLMTMGNPAAWLSLPSSEWGSFFVTG